MRSKEHGNKSTTNRVRHLSLVNTSAGTGASARSIPVAEAPPNMATIRQLTHAMMNRLWIPHTTTIVGLLDVGLSRSNFDELSKWIVGQIATVPDGYAANELPQLERSFHRAVDRFPEL